MAFTRPNFSRHQVDLAGIRLVGEMPLWRRDYQNALAIANNWRSSHSYPLLAMRMTLAGRARRVDGDALVAQRLKRLRSTESKLRRLPHMKLSQMQDIGGCRAVVGSVQQVDDLVSLYELGTAKNPHKRAQFVEKYDYIAQPKGNGYHSVHLVYKYRSGSPPHQVWNGHRIEIQLRSALQHIWATAVETVDTFTGQALKFIGTGERGWDRFFALTSSAFALEEGRPLVPGTPTTMDEIRQELRLLAESLAVHHTLVGLSVAVREGTTGHEKGAEYFLVFLDPVQRELEIEGFREADLWKAQRAYLARETEITGRLASRHALCPLIRLKH